MLFWLLHLLIQSDFNQFQDLAISLMNPLPTYLSCWYHLWWNLFLQLYFQLKLLPRGFPKLGHNLKFSLLRFPFPWLTFSRFFSLMQRLIRYYQVTNFVINLSVDIEISFYCLKYPFFVPDIKVYLDCLFKTFLGQATWFYTSWHQIWLIFIDLYDIWY